MGTNGRPCCSLAAVLLGSWILGSGCGGGGDPGGGVDESLGGIYVDAAACPAVGSGTKEAPFCSIQKALDLARSNDTPGDRILIRPGIYRERVTQGSGGSAAALSGQLSCEQGSTTVRGEGTLFSREVAAGDFVRCLAGHGFRFAEVKSVASDTQLTLREPYPGTSASAVAGEVGHFLQILGLGAAEEVILDGYEPRPASVHWEKVAGYADRDGRECVYRYDSAAAAGAFADPQGFHEQRSDTDIYTVTRGNGADPYFFARLGACPWGSDPNGNGAANEDPADLLYGIGKVSGSWGKSGTIIYVHTWDCANPNEIDLRASWIKEYQALLTSQQPYTIIKNLTAWGGAGSNDRVSGGSSQQRAMVLGGADQAHYENLRTYNATFYLLGKPGMTDVWLQNVRALMGFNPPGIAAGGAGFSGVVLEGVEARGKVSNTVSADGAWGTSAEDRLVYRGWYVHAGWSSKDSSACGEANSFDWKNDRYAAAYERGGEHGVYLGSGTVAQAQNHVLVENCIFELTGDGLGFFLGQGASDVVIRNNLFGVGGSSAEHLILGNLIGSPFGAVLRNNIFFQEKESSDSLSGNYGWWGYGGVSGVDSNHNLFLHPYHSGAGPTARVPNVQSYTLAQARAGGLEAASMEVCQGGCDAAARVFNEGNSGFVDDAIADGDRTDYHLLEGSRAIGAGDAAQCPAVDYDGNRRGESCDIGPFAYGAGGAGGGGGGCGLSSPPLALMVALVGALYLLRRRGVWRRRKAGSLFDGGGTRIARGKGLA